MPQAVKWIEDNIGTYGGDTSRFFIAGHSAGAYNAVMLGLEKSFLADYERDHADQGHRRDLRALRFLSVRV